MVSVRFGVRCEHLVTFFFIMDMKCCVVPDVDFLFYFILFLGKVQYPCLFFVKRYCCRTKGVYTTIQTAEHVYQPLYDVILHFLL